MRMGVGSGEDIPRQPEQASRSDEQRVMRARNSLPRRAVDHWQFNALAFVYDSAFCSHLGRLRFGDVGPHSLSISIPWSTKCAASSRACSCPRAVSGGSLHVPVGPAAGNRSQASVDAIIMRGALCATHSLGR